MNPYPLFPPSPPVRDTGLLVPLLAAIGMACLVTEQLEGRLSSQLETLLADTYLKDTAAFWPATAPPPAAPGQLPIVPTSLAATKTVEALMSTPAQLFVRNSLPLEQVRAGGAFL